jgi:hypothetical protein
LAGDFAGLYSIHARLTSRLDELCALHDGTAARLHQLRRPALERVCIAMRRFDHLRDLMRLRLFAVRNCRLTAPAAMQDRLLAEWPPLLDASKRLARLTAELDAGR